MKIALYIEDGLEQVVLTPESETERLLLSKLTEEHRYLAIKRAEFVPTVGGYIRQGQSRDSVMLVASGKERT
jgi:hypothetical protein